MRAPLNLALYVKKMENITQPTEMFDLILLASSIVLALIYFNNYIYCHIALALGVFMLFLSIVFGETFFSCESTGTIGIYELFVSLKACLPLRPLVTLYLAAILLVAAVTGYARATFTLALVSLKQHITSRSKRTAKQQRPFN